MFPSSARRSRTTMIAALATAAISLTACTGNSSPNNPADIHTLDTKLSAQIDTAIETAMQHSGSNEAIVGVWVGDSGEYVHGYGSNITGETQIRGAQTTQPMMCALLLDLAANKTINLNRKVTKDLTRQAGIDGITYRQLCDMTSGLADFKSEFTNIFANNPTRPWAEKELLSAGIARSPLSWPGRDMHQSDTNILLLNRALRIKTSLSTQTLLSRHVFSRANTKSSYSPDPSDTTITGDTLHGLAYQRTGGKLNCEAGPVKVPEVSPSMLEGAGSIITTVTDLKNFYTHYLDGTFGGDHSQIVTQTFPTKNPKRDKQGKAVEEADTNGRQWSFGIEKQGSLYGRAGSITGTISAAYHDPDAQFTVVVALNNSAAGAGFSKNLAFQIAALFSDTAGLKLPWNAQEKEEALANMAVCPKTGTQ